jgi:hypothetical protein
MRAAMPGCEEAEMRRTAMLLGLAAIIVSAQAVAAALPYLFERLRDPAYNAGFTALFRGQHHLAPWLRGYLRDRNGVDTPGRTVAGGRYELYAVCEPHNCAGNFLYALFVPGGRKAWAMLTRDGRIERFFGAPGPYQRALLVAAAKE